MNIRVSEASPKKIYSRYIPKQYSLHVLIFYFNNIITFSKNSFRSFTNRNEINELQNC